jgi:GNAT superfamily N-acetyltransferase
VGDEASQIGPAEEGDLRFLTTMFAQAARWREDAPALDLAELARDPTLREYFSGWGRTGDAALVARLRGVRAGAAWYRMFTSSLPGYGFVGPEIPELGLAVVSSCRRQGVGQALMAALQGAITMAWTHTTGLRA